MKQETKIPLTFRYREGDDGRIKEAVEALAKLQESNYYGRSISDTVRMIFIPAFKEQAKKHFGKATLKKFGLE